MSDQKESLWYEVPGGSLLVVRSGERELQTYVIKNPYT
jgi:hypothetical protein